MKNANRLVIGTAQFGLDYGISNNSGQVSLEEANKILDYAYSNGVKELDTAATYGESEKVIGNCNSELWSCITKFTLNKSFISPDDIYKSVNLSIKRLKREKLDGLLIHNVEILKKNGEAIIDALRECKRNGLVSKVGVSIYDPNDLELIYKFITPDIVQTPFNAFDQRIQSSGWLNLLKSDGVEVHARSIFLQGLLLMDDQKRPNYFQHWESIFRSWDLYVAKSGVSKLTCALKIVLENTLIDKLIVGVQSLNEISEIITSLNEELNRPWNLEKDLPSSLIDPRKWEI